MAIDRDGAKVRFAFVFQCADLDNSFANAPCQVLPVNIGDIQVFFSNVNITDQIALDFNYITTTENDIQYKTERIVVTQ